MSQEKSIGDSSVLPIFTRTDAKCEFDGEKGEETRCLRGGRAVEGEATFLQVRSVDDAGRLEQGQPSLSASVDSGRDAHSNGRLPYRNKYSRRLDNSIVILM